MSGDYSRRRFDPRDHYTSVLMQQGRVQLDADWNEMAELFERRFRAERVDTFGRAAVPRTGPDLASNAAAFQPTLQDGQLRIGRGRMYVDGLLAENHGPTGSPQSLDPVLDELHGADHLLFTEQPHFNNAPLPPTDAAYLVYLDVWRREVTCLEDPGLVDPAIGVDTTTRIQTAWQVRFLTDPSVTAVATAASFVDLPAFKPSSARLTTATGAAISGEVDPCILPPGGGFRSLENLLYRVEVHQGGDPADPDPSKRPTFKWSRDNASIASAVLEVRGDILVLVTLGRDAVLRLREDDWVELSDDALEARRIPGILARVVRTDDDERTIQLHAPLSTLLAARPDIAAFPGDPTTHHLRVRRWDQSSPIVDDEQNPLELTSGAITIPLDKFVVLENGIKVRFTRDGDGVFRVGDHWTFAARAEDGTVDVLDRSPPHGDHHHYAVLGIVTPPGQVTDLRAIYPLPQTGAGGCCTVHLTADDHNSDKDTIQRALDRLREAGGGALCLDAGVYRLRETLHLDGARNITIRGQGRHTVLARQFKPLAQPEPDLQSFIVKLDDDTNAFDDAKLLEVGGRHAVLRVTNTVGFSLEAVTLLSAEDSYYARHQSAFVNCVDLRIERCTFVYTSPKGMNEVGHAAVVLHKVIAGCHIRDNVFLAKVSVFSLRLLSIDLHIEDNLFQDSLVALCLLAWVPTQTARIAGNRFVGATGMRLDGVCAGTPVEICDNHFEIFRSGIEATLGDLEISGNTIAGTNAGRTPLDYETGFPSEAPGYGIRIHENSLVPVQHLVRIERNRVHHVDTGIEFRGSCKTLRIQDNHLEHMRFAGITAENAIFLDEAVITGNILRDLAVASTARSIRGIAVQRAVSVAIEHNTLERIATPTDGWDDGESTVRAISVESCIDVVVRHNEVYDCGPAHVADNIKLVIAALYVRNFHTRLDIGHNRVSRRSFRNLLQSVMPLFVLRESRELDPTRATVPGPEGRKHALFTDRAIVLAAPAAATIADNSLTTTWNSNQSLPMSELFNNDVSVVDPAIPIRVELTGAPLRFTANNITILRAMNPGGGYELGHFTAPQITSTFNYWTNDTDPHCTINMESRSYVVFGDTYEAVNLSQLFNGPELKRNTDKNLFVSQPYFAGATYFA